MNTCSNIKCGKHLYKHNLFCYNCGFKSTKPEINNIKPLLKRMTHIYCHSCMECIETYSDKYCRNCGIKHLCYWERKEISYYFKNKRLIYNKKKKMKNVNKCIVNSQLK